MVRVELEHIKDRLGVFGVVFARDGGAREEFMPLFGEALCVYLVYEEVILGGCHKKKKRHNEDRDQRGI
jgi:hypothetical protein